MIRLQQLTNASSRKLRGTQWSIYFDKPCRRARWVLEQRRIFELLASKWTSSAYHQAGKSESTFLNLSPPKLCNDIHLKSHLLHRHTIEAKILTGCGVGEAVFVPHNFPFQFKRVQFPVSVCFAMTINKSQGQTLSAVGVNFRTSCFSRGKLYVACSRITSPDSLYILATGSITTTVVWWTSGKGSDSYKL
ncbi:hypothetical protein PYW08_011150 [Mythimna loreyi]|uniref:Uncharacterized protein n=1 Tax=Mythimna loreyi TaxID=667449 RepID=A0ACC2Q2Q9_9NEOP|nr:hypothetical protein PYW08_011150 [Mythimna loreyi]